MKNCEMRKLKNLKNIETRGKRKTYRLRCARGICRAMSKTLGKGCACKRGHTRTKSDRQISDSELETCTFAFLRARFIFAFRHKNAGNLKSKYLNPPAYNSIWGQFLLHRRRHPPRFSSFRPLVLLSLLLLFYLFVCLFFN